MIDPSQVAALPPMPPMAAVPPIAPPVEPIAPMAPMDPMGGLPMDPSMAIPPQDPLAPPPEEKKKPLLIPSMMSHQIARAYADKAVELAATLAAQSGPPDGAVPYTIKKQITMWRSRDPSVNVAEMRANGVPESEIAVAAYPLRPVLLKLAGRSPLDQLKYAQHMKRITGKYDDVAYDGNEPTDEESDETLGHDSEYDQGESFPE